MKSLIAAVILLVGVGCAGVKPEELQALEGRTRADLAKESANLSKQITEMDKKYATVMQLENRTTKSLEQIEKWSAQLGRANDQMIQILEAQEKALKDQLATVEAILADLKKK